MSKMWILLVRGDCNKIDIDWNEVGIEDDSWYTLYVIGCYTDYSLVEKYSDDCDYRVLEVEANRGVSRLAKGLSTWSVSANIEDGDSPSATDLGFWNSEVEPQVVD